jgi:hypothetical protein
MRGDRIARMLSVVALIVAVLALVVAGRALVAERDHARQVEALGELIRRSAATGRPIMDMGPPGGGGGGRQPELDPGD